VVAADFPLAGPLSAQRIRLCMADFAAAL